MPPKRKVNTAKMDPRKTREPVSDHPNPKVPTPPTQTIKVPTPPPAPAPNHPTPPAAPKPTTHLPSPFSPIAVCKKAFKTLEARIISGVKAARALKVRRREEFRERGKVFEDFAEDRIEWLIREVECWLLEELDDGNEEDEDDNRFWSRDSEGYLEEGADRYEEMLCQNGAKWIVESMPPPTTSEACTQTSPPPPPPRPTVNSVSMNTDAPTTPPRLTYAEAATNTPPPPNTDPLPRQHNSAAFSPYEDISEYEREEPLGHHQKGKQRAYHHTPPHSRPPTLPRKPAATQLSPTPTLKAPELSPPTAPTASSSHRKSRWGPPLDLDTVMSKSTSSAKPPASPDLAEFSPYEDISEYERDDISPPPPNNKGLTRRSTVVVHAVSTKYKVGEVRRWLEEDNQNIRIAGGRWLLNEERREGKTHSSMVLYLQYPTTTRSLKLGRRSLRTTTYEWDR